jgi:NAD(P)-dependent dehydrogenase (short-subunit alcohol dehydrogenase family)
LSDRTDKVTVTCVDPGYALTDLVRHSSIHKTSYSPSAYFFKTFLKTPEMAAQPVIYAILSDELNGVNGKFIRYVIEY